MSEFAKILSYSEQPDLFCVKMAFHPDLVNSVKMGTEVTCETVEGTKFKGYVFSRSVDKNGLITHEVHCDRENFKRL